MISKRYQKKTQRSKRKLQKLPDEAVKVDIADGQATFQMVLPMNALMAEVAHAIEEMSCQTGLLMMKAMIDEEVEQLAALERAKQDKEAHGEIETEHPGCLTSPHAVALTPRAMDQIYESMANDMVAVLHEQQPRFVVNPQALCLTSFPKQ